MGTNVAIGAKHLESEVFRARHEVPRRKKIIICQLLLFVRSNYLQRFSGALDNVLYYQVYKLIE